MKGIFITSILESTILPVPLEAILIPVMQARRDRIWVLAMAATIGCILGSLLGYALGYFLFELAQSWVVGTLTSQEQLDHVISQMRQQGFYFVLTLGIVPIPLQIAMIAAGAIGYSLPLYIVAIAISRIIRYFGIAIVVYYAGNRAEQLIKKYRYSVLTLLMIGITSIWWFQFY